MTTRKPKAVKYAVPTGGRLIAPRPKQKFGCDKILKRVDEFLAHEKEPDYYLNKLRNDLQKKWGIARIDRKSGWRAGILLNNKYVYSLFDAVRSRFWKSNIIGWTALQLKDLRRNRRWVYDKILIVVERGFNFATSLMI